MSGMPSTVLRGPDLLPRIATVVVGAPLVGVVLWLGGLWWVALVEIVVASGAAEFTHLHSVLRPANRAGVILGSVALTAVPLALSGARETWLLGVATGIVVAGIVARMVLVPPPAFAVRPGAVTVLGVVYLGLAGAVLIGWRFSASFVAVVWFLVMIWANDVAAYFVGLAAGRHKLAPRISPGKSWEGAVAGGIAAAVVGAAAAPAFGLMAGTGALFGVLGSMASQVGDLFESALKRQAGVKDSGALLPGHGGVLDRFDGILVAAPVGYLLLRLLAR